MPTWIGETEAMIRFARRIGIISTKSETLPKEKPKKVIKPPPHPKGMP